MREPVRGRLICSIVSLKIISQKEKKNADVEISSSVETLQMISCVSDNENDDTSS